MTLDTIGLDLHKRETQDGKGRPDEPLTRGAASQKLRTL